MLVECGLWIRKIVEWFKEASQAILVGPWKMVLRVIGIMGDTGFRGEEL